MRKSLARLSSGKRIVSPADDAGGMAVGYKIDSALKRAEAVRQNLQNGISFLQVQDGAMNAVAGVLNRMAELKTMASDVVRIHLMFTIIRRSLLSFKNSFIRSNSKSLMVLVYLRKIIILEMIFKI